MGLWKAFSRALFQRLLHASLVRAQSRDAFVRLPQVAVEHQRRVPFLDVSKKRSTHDSWAHDRIRSGTGTGVGGEVARGQEHGVAWVVGPAQLAGWLLFLDWTTGTTLQLTGEAHTEYDPDP